MKGFAVSVSSAILGCIAGSLFGLWFTERLERRKTMMIAGFCFMISAVGSALAFSIWDFTFWRFVGVFTYLYCKAIHINTAIQIRRVP